MSDVKTREAERAALAGGNDEYAAHARILLRADPEKPTEIRHTLTRAFCALCGEKAAHVYQMARVGLTWPYRATYDKDRWRKTVDGKTPAFVNAGWSGTKAAESDVFVLCEEQLRAEDPSGLSVMVSCDEGHRWETSLTAVWLEPLPPEEEGEDE